VELRNKYDPYTVISSSELFIGHDLTIFFWLSILALFLAAILTLVLMVCLKYLD